MPFEFINNNAAIDRAARKRIRSHVAMGRNAGKTLVRPSRKKALGLGLRAKTTTTAAALAYIPKKVVVEKAHDSETTCNEEVVPEIERQLGDGLSVLPVAAQVTPGSRVLVQRGMYVGHIQTENANSNIHRVSSLTIVSYLYSYFLHWRASTRTRTEQCA